ncbi:MAG: hypothetical protein ABI881_04865 [Betaproteobacteria bacterium]
MDTSIPSPDSPPPEWPPAPREQALGDVTAHIAAIDEIVGYARSRIQVFDTDMSWGGWSRAARVDALSRYLRANRHAALDVIVHDTRWLEAASGRLLSMLRQFPHAVTIYRTGSEAAGAMDPLVVVDRAHCVHRFHIDQPRGSLVIAQPAAVKSLAARFDEIWSTGEPGLSSTTLGL